jgi:ATP-dependent HslUV protease ATP-binding subunit HslU
MRELTPREVVEELDKYIIGQKEAKKAVAVALRNRYRRDLLPPELRDEVIPKNILMIGPTGVGKTEIARRLARLSNAPFIKVEATRYTEVGYVGRDVESMIRELVEISVRMEQKKRLQEVEKKAGAFALERLLNIMMPHPRRETAPNPLMVFLGGASPAPPPPAGPDEEERLDERREELRAAILRGDLDDKFVEIEVDEEMPSMVEIFTGTGMEGMGVDFEKILGGMIPRKKKRRNVRIKEALNLLAHDEAQKLIDPEEVKREAVSMVERHGIVFVDEMDKIAGRERGYGPDVSREGVQRDILPIVEGSTVTTKYGPVRTDHILFIGAGAFHTNKPSDLIPELQGRFPIRVELSSLTMEDFILILREPENALIKQYAALLATEGISITFSPDGIEEIARLAELVNSQTENIGARRLHTMMEKLLEDLSFEAPERGEEKLAIDRAYVRSKLEKIVVNEDLSRFIL